MVLIESLYNTYEKKIQSTKMPHLIIIYNLHIFTVGSNRIMSENISLAKQRACTDLRCEDEKYIIDVFSYVQPGHHGNESRKQVLLYITREVESSRKAFLQVRITEQILIKGRKQLNLSLTE